MYRQVVFFVQHYVLYKPSESSSDAFDEDSCQQENNGYTAIDSTFEDKNEECWSVKLLSETVPSRMDDFVFKKVRKGTGSRKAEKKNITNIW